jgi:hypothetical protein
MRTMKITEVLRLQRNTTHAYQQSGFEERSGFGSRAGNRKSTLQKKAAPPLLGFELTLDDTNEADSFGSWPRRRAFCVRRSVRTITLQHHFQIFVWLFAPSTACFQVACDPLKLLGLH